MKKKMLLALSTAATAAMLLTGCGGDSADDNMAPKTEDGMMTEDSMMTDEGMTDDGMMTDDSMSDDSMSDDSMSDDDSMMTEDADN